MPVVRAGPNQFLLVGRKGVLENRGSAVQAILRPGTVYVLIPSTKQEATFEFTQETRDGIPLRFKGSVLYRITDPIAAARQFDFTDGEGPREITAQLTQVTLAELRHAVSHMTMTECIEQRKTTLSGVVSTALATTIHDAADRSKSWGVEVEVAHVAQVYIVDPQLRQQLEAEVRNEIKLKSDRSNMQSAEAIQLAELASEGRVQEQKLATDREALRRTEELELAQLARHRRMQVENLETEQQVVQLAQQRLHSELDAERDRVTSETPVRLLRIEHERAILLEEIELRQLQNALKALDVDGELLLAHAQQDMRREMLPIEQAPRIVESASKVLRGANLSIYGEDGRLLGQLAPFFELLTRAVETASADRVRPAPGSDTGR